MPAYRGRSSDSTGRPGGLEDLDGLEAVAVGMGVEQCKLLLSMHSIYVAGRYAVFAGLNPTAANLLHHAVEMALKGALAKKGMDLKALKK